MYSFGNSGFVLSIDASNRVLSIFGGILFWNKNFPKLILSICPALYYDHEPRHVHLKCFRVCSDDGCSFASAAPFCMCRAVAIRMSTMPGPGL